MKRYLPSRVEFGFLVAMAIVGGLVVKIAPSHDFALAAMAMPVFFIASLMGLRRSGALAPVAVEEEQSPTAGLKPD